MKNESIMDVVRGLESEGKPTGVTEWRSKVTADVVCPKEFDVMAFDIPTAIEMDRANKDAMLAYNWRFNSAPGCECPVSQWFVLGHVLPSNPDGKPENEVVAPVVVPLATPIAGIPNYYGR